MIISKAFLIAVGDNPNTSAVEALVCSSNILYPHI